MTRLLIAITLFAVALIGCGGGGGGSSGAGGGGGVGTSSFTGVAVDGYLHNARAFLDLNNNGIYDAGEPTAMTNSSGSFTLDATQAQIDTYPVVVVAIAGTTVDQDNPSAPITSGMTLMSPPGNHSVVSPLTTQVVAKMATGLSLADAKTAVQTDLGLSSVDLMKDFISEKVTNPAYLDAHKIASSVATSYMSAESQLQNISNFGDKLIFLNSKISNEIVPSVSSIKAASIGNDLSKLLNGIKADQLSNYRVSTYTGSATDANASNWCRDGNLSIARFWAPGGATVDSQGNVYIADWGCHSIRKISANGTVTTVAGRNGIAGSTNGTISTATFNMPFDVTIDSSGNLYVADWGNELVRKISVGGTVTTYAGNGNTGYVDGPALNAEFHRPHGVVVDKSGNLFVSTTGNHAIRKISTDGLVSTIAGGGDLIYPYTNSGYFADGVGQQAKFKYPTFIAIDDDENLYISDDVKIRVMSKAGRVSTLVSNLVDGSGGIKVSPSGVLFVVSGGSIKKVSKTGTVITVAGGADTTQELDGDGASAKFKDPFGLALSKDGVIYVTTLNGRTVRKIERY